MWVMVHLLPEMSRSEVCFVMLEHLVLVASRGRSYGRGVLPPAGLHPSQKWPVEFPSRHKKIKKLQSARILA